MKARLIWVGKSKSQQDAILRNGRYTTVARFGEEDEGDWLKEAWSLDLSELTIESDEAMIASVRFLSPDAPVDRLRPDMTFELYEGRKCTARGKIIG